MHPYWLRVHCIVVIERSAPSYQLISPSSPRLCVLRPITACANRPRLSIDDHQRTIDVVNNDRVGETHRTVLLDQGALIVTKCKADSGTTSTSTTTRALKCKYQQEDSWLVIISSSLSLPTWLFLPWDSNEFSGIIFLWSHWILSSHIGKPILGTSLVSFFAAAHDNWHGRTSAGVNIWPNISRYSQRAGSQIRPDKWLVASERASVWAPAKNRQANQSWWPVDRTGKWHN